MHCRLVVLEPPLRHLHGPPVPVPVHDGLGDEALGVLSRQLALGPRQLDPLRRHQRRDHLSQGVQVAAVPLRIGELLPGRAQAHADPRHQVRQFGLVHGGGGGGLLPLYCASTRSWPSCPCQSSPTSPWTPTSTSLTTAPPQNFCLFSPEIDLSDVGGSVPVNNVTSMQVIKILCTVCRCLS